MESFFVVIFCFLLSLAGHILIHKYLRVTAARLAVVYIVGAGLLYGSWLTGFILLPLSSGFLYLLLSVSAIVIYLAVSLGTEAPTSIILASFRSKKQQTFNNLTSLFTDNGLIIARIDDLLQSKLIERQGGVWKLTRIGYVVFSVMKIYRWIFYRKNTE